MGWRGGGAGVPVGDYPYCLPPNPSLDILTHPPSGTFSPNIGPNIASLASLARPTLDKLKKAGPASSNPISPSSLPNQDSPLTNLSQSYKADKNYDENYAADIRKLDDMEDEKKKGWVEEYCRGAEKEEKAGGVSGLVNRGPSPPIKSPQQVPPNLASGSPAILLLAHQHHSAPKPAQTCEEAWAE